MFDIQRPPARVYRRRRAERTVLYRLAQQHLETWLARTREIDPDGIAVARHIERQLRGYLECGILAFGFARARCPQVSAPTPQQKKPFEMPIRYF